MELEFLAQLGLETVHSLQASGLFASPPAPESRTNVEEDIRLIVLVSVLDLVGKATKENSAPLHRIVKKKKSKYRTTKEKKLPHEIVKIKKSKYRVSKEKKLPHEIVKIKKSKYRALKEKSTPVLGIIKNKKSTSRTTKEKSSPVHKLVTGVCEPPSHKSIKNDKDEIRLIIKNLVDKVVRQEKSTSGHGIVKNEKSTRRRGGQPTRRTYDAGLKASAVKDVESGMHPEEVAAKYGTCRSNIIKWVVKMGISPRKRKPVHEVVTPICASPTNESITYVQGENRLNVLDLEMTMKDKSMPAHKTVRVRNRKRPNKKKPVHEMVTEVCASPTHESSTHVQGKNHLNVVDLVKTMKDISMPVHETVSGVCAFPDNDSSNVAEEIIIDLVNYKAVQEKSKPEHEMRTEICTSSTHDSSSNVEEIGIVNKVMEEKNAHFNHQSNTNVEEKNIIDLVNIASKEKSMPEHEMVIRVCNPPHESTKNIEDDICLIIKDLVDKVVTQEKRMSEHKIEKKSTPTNSHGQATRRTYKLAHKVSAVEEVESGMHPEDVATIFGTCRSNIIKWVRRKDMLFSKARNERKTQAAKLKPSTKYNDLFKELYDKFVQCRFKGYRISFAWICSNARKIHCAQTGDDRAVLKHHVVTTFLRRYNIKVRKRKRSENVSKEGMRVKLLEWHTVTREKLIRTGRDDNYNEKWGRFTPEQRLNVDQSPCPFLFESNRTFLQSDDWIQANKRRKKILVPGQSAGFDQRQCTLQICFSPSGRQPRLGIVFRGTGSLITAAERELWHPDVDVYFQQNAMVDSQVCREWVTQTLKPAAHHLDRFVLFTDNNLSSLCKQDFKDEVTKCSGVVWYGLPNADDLWQPVNAGYAQVLKTLMQHENHRWLDEEDHAERWYCNTVPYSSKERRILITQWAGEAYKRLSSSAYDGLRRTIWTKTGCLITADGSEDKYIAPKGLPDYKVPPPHQYLLPTLDLATTNSVEQSANEDVLEAEIDEDEDLDQSEPDERVDRVEDRIEDEYTGRQIIALYANGWFTGTIRYFNNHLGEYNILYHDDTEDYITLTDIDGAELQLI